ncbi:MAG: hypothetical protein M0Z42_14710, partial [Actinomycetota bacterium]|nr:hypothetical protein [Actinomycetota bacterium]
MARLFEAADLLFEAMDTLGEAFEGSAQVGDLRGQSREGAGVAASAAVFLTERAGTGTVWTVVRCGPKTGGAIIMVTYDLTALAPRLSADVERFAREVRA